MIIQACLYFEWIGNKELTDITETDLIFSIVAAGVNSVAQLMKIYLESAAVGETFVQYVLTCIMGRVGWIPFQNQLSLLLSEISEMNSIDTENENDDDIENIPIQSSRKTLRNRTVVLDYKISYRIPIISSLIGLKPSVEFYFSSVTLRSGICAVGIVAVAFFVFTILLNFPEFSNVF